MAEKEQKDRNLPPRDFIDALVEDPANPPQLQVLTGYRGRSAQEGHTRFYVDLVLTAWADVPDDAILFQREIQDELGLSKSLVWTRLDAQIQVGPQTDGGTGADFLQGQVAQDLGGGVGGFGTRILPRTPFRICPPPPIRTLLIRECLPPSPVFVCRTTHRDIACPPITSGPGCELQTFNQPQCQTLGCPPPTPGIFCPTPVVVCQTLIDPNCGLATAGQPQCPSLGITCTALPPCPPRTAPPACPQTPGIACIPSVLIACPPITQIPQLCGLQTQNVAQCVPQPTSNPQLCPVATPNPGCIPGGPGGPGGPVEGVQGAQDFGNFNAGNFNWQWQPQPTVAEPQCQIVPQTPATAWCQLGTPQVLITTEPQCDPASSWCPTTPLTPNLGGFGGQGFEVQGGMGAEAVTQICPVPRTQICPVPQTQLCPIPRTRFCPVPQTIQWNCRRTIFEPQCYQVTPPWQIPITTTPQIGGFGQGVQGFQGAEGMGAAAVGGPGGPAPVPQTLACPSQFVACTQLCPAPNTLQLTCPVTRNIQCFTSRLCPRSTFCPSVSIPCQTGALCPPLPTTGCPFGGGGGFGGGF